MRKIAKSRRPQAERAGEWYLRKVGGCTVTNRTRRVVIKRGNKFVSFTMELWHCDVWGRKSDGSGVYAQVTTGGSEALRVRRRKIELIPWHESETVLVLQLTSTPDPANRRRTLWWFRVHRYDMAGSGRCWFVDVRATPVPKEWFKAWKEVPK
jgi:hypothetical protein